MIVNEETASRRSVRLSSVTSASYAAEHGPSAVANGAVFAVRPEGMAAQSQREVPLTSGGRRARRDRALLVADGAPWQAPTRMALARFEQDIAHTRAKRFPVSEQVRRFRIRSHAPLSLVLKNDAICGRNIRHARARGERYFLLGDGWMATSLVERYSDRQFTYRIEYQRKRAVRCLVARGKVFEPACSSRPCRVWRTSRRPVAKVGIEMRFCG